jgi:hypothetical protein
MAELGKDETYIQKQRENRLRHLNENPEAKAKAVANLQCEAMRIGRRAVLLKRNADPAFQRKVHLIKSENKRRIGLGLDKMTKEEKEDFLATRGE